MAFFTQKYHPRLFVAADAGGDSRGFVALLIPMTVPDKDLPAAGLELAAALTNPVYLGTFVFSAATPAIKSEQDAASFYQLIQGLLPANTRGFLWAHHAEQYQDAAGLFSVDTLYINANGSVATTGLGATLVPQGLLLNVASGVALSLTGTVLQLKASDSAVSFSGNLGPTISSPVALVEIDFAGPLRGCLRFQAQLLQSTVMLGPDSTLGGGLALGLRFMYLNPAAKPHPGPNPQYYTGFFPLAQTTSEAPQYLWFDISIDPTDAFNTVFATTTTLPVAYSSRRTYLNFTALAPSPALYSYYTTVYGARLSLLPVTAAAPATLGARLVLAAGQDPTDYYLAPEGDFTLLVADVPTASRHQLMGGQQGTEFFEVTTQTATTAGDRLRFISGQPALAPVFPFAPASPVGPPPREHAALLTADCAACTTAWATLLSAPGNPPITYVAQPKGAALFGAASPLTTQYPDLFGHVAPGFTVLATDSVAFPLIPYAGARVERRKNNAAGFSQADLVSFENLVVSPTRRTQVARLTPAPPRLSLAERTAAGGKTITTPTGLLVTLPPSGDAMQWSKVLLGQNTDGRAYELAFENPVPQLVEALQTSDLLLVAANANYLSNAASGAAFANQMGIGGWRLQVNVGQRQEYGDYRNIMLIKGRRGPLYDPRNVARSLVINPSSWTQPDVFAAPTTGLPGSPPDPRQLPNLAQWLQDYFQAAVVADEAAQQTGAARYFQKFNALAQDETWTGILFLRVDLASGGLPGSLAGIVAGVTDADAFNAHHLAIDISPVKKSGTDAVLEHPSTMAGLIYYVDPAFVDAPPYATLPPATAGDYDFRLLTLKVLFENTAVKSFESYAQLTIGRLFGAAVLSSGNPANVYNNLLLTGSLQLSGGNPVYNLGTTSNNAFELDSNIIRQVAITNALLTTRDTGTAQQQAFWFGLQGYLDYYALAYTTAEAPEEVGSDPAPQHSFDLFSFGANAQGEGRGLAFANLGIAMTYPAATPTARTLRFDAGEVRFDLSTSTVRDASLVTNFALDEVELLRSPTLTDPSAAPAGPDTLGYLPVITDMRLDGVSGPEWYGLKMLLRLGTPGELAGKASLNAYLLLAWDAASTGPTHQASVQLQLPGTTGGASLISLQNVLKLSVGQIRLAFVPPTPPPAGSLAAPGKSAFLLMFTQVALQFLGLLKIPPTGSTLFYLFGNPNANGKASGLGWYAMYKKAAAPKSLSPARSPLA